MDYYVDAACVCDTGSVRKNNEDNFFFGGESLNHAESELGLVKCEKRLCGDNAVYAVFDGVGGEADGEEASLLAALELGKLVEQESENDNLLRYAALKMNDRVVEDTAIRGNDIMATTMAALRFTPKRVCVCNVGDSRVYKLDGKKLALISLDHTAPVTEGEQKGRLSQYIGQKKALVPFFTTFRPQLDDRYLICSDGVSDMLTDERIAKLLAYSPKKAAEKLLAASLEAGGRDNITAIVCRIVKK